MADKTPIVIAGGGIGGLAAAAALSAPGPGGQSRRCLVLEQGAEFGEIGAGIQLGPNAFKMFERFGITDKIEEVAFFPGNLVMMDNLTGEEVTRVALGDRFRARFGYPYGVIHRADLHRVLLDLCASRAQVELRTSCKVTGYQETDGGVTVHTDGGDIEAAALIGADGLWSKVRGAIVGDGAPRVSGHIAYRAVLPVEQVPEDLYSDNVVLWGGQRRHLVHYPLRRGELYNLVAVFHSSRYEEGWDSFGDPEELHAQFADAVPQVRRLLEKIEAWRMWVLCDREPVKRWSAGRAVLLGDAAHPMLQYLAQGAVMAMEDAQVLAEAVEKDNGDFAAAFEAYTAKRYLRTARVQVTARYYGDLYHASGVVRELRNQLLSGRDPENPEGMAWLYDGI